MQKYLTSMCKPGLVVCCLLKGTKWEAGNSTIVMKIVLEKACATSSLYPLKLHDLKCTMIIHFKFVFACFSHWFFLFVFPVLIQFLVIGANFAELVHG